MGAMDDLLAEYEGNEPAVHAKADGSAKYPTAEELFGKGSDAPASAQSDSREPNPLVMDPQTKKLVPQRRTYATFTDVPGQKFTAEQLANIKTDTRMAGPAALAGGALQGATLGYGDELSAGFGALTGQGEYSKLRDENRRANAEVKAGSPLDYAIGEIGGGVLSPANVLLPGSAGKPLLTMGNTAKAAAIGGGVGLGASDADLTKGDYWGAAKDTARGVGAGVGMNTAFGGLGAGVRYLKSTPSRVAKRADDELIDKLSLGATATERDAMVGELGKDKGKVLDFVRSDSALKQAVLDGEYNRAVEILRGKKDSSARLGADSIKELEQRWGKQDVDPVLETMEKVRAKYAKNPSLESQKAAEEIEKRMMAIREKYVPEPPKPEPKGKELLAVLSEGAGASEKQKIGDNAALYEQVIAKHKLGKAANDPEARYSAIDGAVDELGKRKEALYGKVKQPMLITDVTLPLVKWKEELAQSSEGLKAVPAVGAMIKRIWESRGKGGQRLEMSVKELREEISDMQKAGFAGPYFDPSVAQDLQRRASGIMKEALDNHIATAGGKRVAEGVAELNKEYSVLLTLRDIAERQRASARLVPPAPPDTRTGQAGVGDLFDLANKTETPEAKAAIMSGLTGQMDRTAEETLAKINADAALMKQIEDPLVHLGTRNSTPSTTLRARAKEGAARLGEAGMGGALMASAMGNFGLGGATLAASLILKYGPNWGTKAEPVLAKMVSALGKGASRLHLQSIGIVNKLPKPIVDDMISTLTAQSAERTAAAEAADRL